MPFAAALSSGVCDVLGVELRDGQCVTGQTKNGVEWTALIVSGQNVAMYKRMNARKDMQLSVSWWEERPQL